MKPHEDWVYEYWTVDCVCGVDFDDGKEMVDCDECGVWVHTWCSRYVKGDDLFFCYKCKIENNDNKVSKLTMRMVNSSNQTRTVPLKSCSEIPIEERVHEQGVPGGDLALFERFSSVFSRQLWKCTGYVPKKFRFQYREFPCWNDKENECQIGNQEDTCAGVLVLMVKGDNVDSKRTNDEKLSIKDIRKWGARDFEMSSSKSELNKDKNLVCPLSTNKGRRESQVASEERVKKKIKVADKEEEADKKGFVGKTCYFSSLTATERL